MTELHFITFGSLEPVDNGYKSSATQLVRQLARQVRLTHFRLPKVGERAAPAEDAFDDVCRRAGVTIVRVALDRTLPGMRFLRPTGAAWVAAGGPRRPDWVRALRDAGLGANGVSVVGFGMGWDPFAVAALQEFEHATFFPSDSITLFERNRRVGPHPLARLRRRLALALARSMERRVLRSAIRRVFFVSRRDAACAARLAGNRGRVRVIPLGIDPAEFPQASNHPQPAVLIFTGVMDYLPNQDAARFLAHEVFPRVRTPGARLRLVGKGAEQLSGVDRPGVDRIGWVASMPEALRQATLFVSPLRMGAGAKNKVVQAMAAGLPVVGTRGSFSGFTARPPGTFGAETAAEFAGAIDALLADPGRLHAEGARARQYALAHCTWAASAERLRAEVESARHATRPKRSKGAR